MPPQVHSCTSLQLLLLLLPVTLTLASCVVCDQLAVSQKAFEEFYAKKFTGRQLTWQHSLGHCAMAAFFPLVHTAPPMHATLSPS